MLALGDADNSFLKGRHKEAFDANTRAIGWLYTAIQDNAITREEADELADPIIRANAAYQRGIIHEVHVPFEAVDKLADLFLQKTCQCQCG